MSNESSNTSLVSVKQMTPELLNVLRTSLFVGAQDDSIKAAVAYCIEAGLDIMQKPVHLVPMWDSKTKTMRDVVMPGIGLYRTQAARSGSYAGVTEPEFGPDVTNTFPAESAYGGKTRDEVVITYPAWCKVVVKRLMPNGQVAEFAAIERWIENYATAGKDSRQPNAMWQRRPYGQLAKCAEAQALRKAFPEFGSAPTADEMEGKVIDMGTVEHEGPKKESARPELPKCPQDVLEAEIPKWEKVISAGKKTAQQILDMAVTRYALSDEQKKQILDLEPPIDGEYTTSEDSAQ